MIESVELRWALTGLFLVTGCYSVTQLVVLKRWRERLGALLHVLMSAAMVVMAWPWGVGVFVGPQIALFSIATAWFVGEWVTAARRSGSNHDAHPSWHQAFHAAMMGAMVWMLAAMPANGEGGHVHGSLPAWSAVAGVAFLVMIVAAASVLLVDLLSSASRGVRAVRREIVDAAMSVLMALGMALMVGIMVYP